MPASATWEDPLDPGEVKDYTLDFGPENRASNDDTISTAIWALSAAAVAAGVEVHSMSHDADTATVWLSVTPANQDTTLFDDPGQVFVSGAIATVETTGGRTFHRSVTFTVVRL